MKNILIGMITILLLSSCSKDDKANDLLVGEWKMTKISSTYPNDNIAGELLMLYIFNSDNTGLMNSPDGGGVNIERRFKYKLGSNNKRLTITHSDSESMEYTVDKLSNNQLIISLKETTLEFEKREYNLHNTY